MTKHHNIDLKRQIASLVDDILKYKRAYYQGRPLISDVEYDKLEEQLRILSPQHPILELVGDGSPGKQAKDETLKVSHYPPMLSLAKTYSKEDLFSWANNEELVATLKVDGVSLSLIYEEGHLVLAKTRGDGALGEDVTKKIKWVGECLIPTIPLNFEIRGELYCLDQQFAELSLEMESLGLERPNSPRNIIAGILGRKHHDNLARFFSFFAFDALVQESPFQTEMEKYSWLQSLGFHLPYYELVRTPGEIEKCLEYTRSLMEDAEIGIDGAVFALNDLKKHQALGVTAHHPRYKLSFKWQGDSKPSVIKDIKWATSRLGIVTPVAIIEPVYLSSANITNVTLHNASYVKLFNLKVGDRIEIVRSGEVIPKFLRVIESVDGHYSFPSLCPMCKTVLVFDEVRLTCPNTLECSAQQFGMILNWVHAVEIDDLSDKRLQAMVDLGLIKHVSDLYRLSMESMLKLPLTKEKMASKILANIKKSQSVTLSKFLSGLGVPGMGKALWEELLKYFPGLEALLQAKEAEISVISGFGELRAKQLVQSFSQKKLDIEKLLAVGVNPSFVQKPSLIQAGIFSGLTFVVTGSLSKPRQEIAAGIQAVGGKLSDSVSKNTHALITDDPNSSSSKAKKARELAIPIWSEKDLEEKLNNLEK